MKLLSKNITNKYKHYIRESERSQVGKLLPILKHRMGIFSPQKEGHK